MANSPLLYGPNNTAINLQSGEVLSNGTLINSNGPINYVKNYNFANGLTTGYSLGIIGTLTNGLPTGTPTFGSGASGNLSLSVVSSGNLFAAQSAYSLSYASSAATTVGNMVASDPLPIDVAMQAKVLTYGIYYSVPVGPTTANFSGTSSNSFGVACWDVTNSAWLPVVGSFAMTQTTGVGYTTGTLQTGVTTASVRLCVYNVNATTGAVTLYFGSVTLGPQTVPVGAPVTDWQTYSLAITGSATSPTIGTATSLAKWRRVGDSIEINYWLAQTAAGTAGSGNYIFGLPNGFQIDTTKVSASPANTNGVGAHIVGVGNVSNTSSPATSTATPVVIVPYNSTGLAILFNGGVLNQENVIGSASFSLASTTINYAFSVTVPVTGLSSNVQMSNDTDTRVVDFVGNNVSTQAVTADTTNISFVTVKDSHGAWTGTTYVVPVSGDYNVSLMAYSSTSTSDRFDVYVNAVSNKFLFLSTSGNPTAGTSIIPNLKAGDVLSFRCHSSDTLASAITCAINRLSGPSVIAATESVNARYFSSASTVSSSSAVVTFTTKARDTHNAYSGGIYTIPVSGMYQVNAAIEITGTFVTNSVMNVSIYQNGSAVSGVQENAGGALSAMNALVTDAIPCLAGDQLTIRALNTGTSPVISASTSLVYFSIARVGN